MFSLPDILFYCVRVITYGNLGLLLESVEIEIVSLPRSFMNTEGNRQKWESWNSDH